MAEVYSLSITGVYDDGNGRLVQGPLQWSVPPVCCLCLGLCVEVPPCEYCHRTYCTNCIPCRQLSTVRLHRVLCHLSCGLFPEGQSRQGPICIATPSSTDYDSPRTIAESASTGDTAGTNATPVAIQPPKLYEDLLESADANVALPFGTLMRHAVALGDLHIEDEIGSRPFGTAVDDFTRLCRNAAWDYPNGLVLLNLDRRRCLTFTAQTSYTAHPVPAYSALRWMQTTPGTFGLTLRAAGGAAECALFAVPLRDEHGDAHLKGRARRLLQLVRSWT